MGKPQVVSIVVDAKTNEYIAHYTKQNIPFMKYAELGKYKIINVLATSEQVEALKGDVEEAILDILP